MLDYYWQWISSRWSVCCHLILECYDLTPIAAVVLVSSLATSAAAVSYPVFFFPAGFRDSLQEEFDCWCPGPSIIRCSMLAGYRETTPFFVCSFGLSGRFSPAPPQLGSLIDPSPSTVLSTDLIVASF